MDKKRLVKLCQKGDKEAFGILYQTYLPLMQKIVAYYVHNEEVEWDILHDGFLIAFESINSLKNASKLESWLTSIMKNLALQHLKKESSIISIPLSDNALINEKENSQNYSALSWDELNKIINSLPEGYGKVFRLALLDGLSHKEIGRLLGIAPHSSSSQLAHAKAKMRHLIIKYKAEIGVVSIIAIFALIWQYMINNEGNAPTGLNLQTTNEFKTQDLTDPTKYEAIIHDTIDTKKPKIHVPMNSLIHNNIADEYNLKNIEESSKRDSIVNDSITTLNDTINILKEVFDKEELIAEDDIIIKRTHDHKDWTFSLAYAGSFGERDQNRYNIPISNDPTANSDDEIEVTEKTRHYMPLVLGFSVNKVLTPSWSIETGLRYTYLRSDFLLESTIINRETIQRIHYIGIPLKLNYKISTFNGFSIYGQGGASLDIPVMGKRDIREISNVLDINNTEKSHFTAPLQWSVEGGVGIQYNITPVFSIYAEPSFRYYFKPDSNIKTIRQEKPFEFTIPISVRLTW